MNTPDSGAFAINAAGIADSMCSLAHTEPSGDAQTARVTEHFEGAAGVMARVAEAGAAMERYRITRGSSATWGGELPYLYDVWDAIARALRDQCDEEPVERLVARVIDALATAAA